MYSHSNAVIHRIKDWSKTPTILGQAYFSQINDQLLVIFPERNTLTKRSTVILTWLEIEE